MLVKLNRTNAGYYTYDSENSPINQDFLRTEINLDILHGCDQMCPGCFIPRKNLTSANHLTTLYDLLVNGQFYPDEINVGPTDIFDAQNFYELMSHPSMKKLYSISSIGYSTTLLQDIEVIKKKHKIVWDLYEDINRIPDIDFKIVLDINKYLDNELDDWYKKLELFKEGSVQFRVNYHKDIFKRISYNDLCERVFKDFNAPIVITPSFLTDRNVKGKVEQHLKTFREDLLDQKIDPKWINLYTFFDAKFNGFGCQNYSFYNGKLYINPFLYDAIIQRTPEFETELDATVLSNNLEYAQEIQDCLTCEFILSCAERNVHMYMRSRKLKSCVAIKEYMNASH
jgi:hypothetical protein